MTCLSADVLRKLHAPRVVFCRPNELNWSTIAGGSSTVDSLRPEKEALRKTLLETTDPVNISSVSLHGGVAADRKSTRLNSSHWE